MALDLSQLLLVFFSVLLCALLAQWLLKIRRLPPGPWGVPIFGYLPFFKAVTPEKQFKELSEKYGDIFGLTLGQQYVVVLSSYAAVKEAIIKQGEIFAGRPKHYNHLNVFNDFKTVITTDGDNWKEQRRFIMSSLRDFGLGKKSLDQRIQEEAEEALQIIQHKYNNCRSLPLLFSSMANNIICILCFGQRFDYGNPKLHKFTEIMDKTSKLFEQAGLLDAFPILAFLSESWTKIDILKKYRDELCGFMDEIIEEHIETFDSNNPRDLIDMYLQKRQELGINEKEEDTNSVYSRSHMSLNLMILFFAGTDTLATTLYWGIKLMALYPEVQKKVQEELDRVIGRSRLPNWNDRQHLPYTEATLLEIQRIASIVPLSVVHSNLEEAVVRGFTIPKRSLILINIWQIHYDPNLWNNPDKFDPNRFLSKGKLIKPEYLIPFSAGKRICLGESLARVELFIFFSSILHNFNINYKGEEPLQLNIEPGAVTKVATFDADIEPR